jgi:hypothetical protein
MKKYTIILLLFITAESCMHLKGQVNDYSDIRQSTWVIPQTDTLTYAFDTYEGANALLLKRNFANYKSASIAYPKSLDFKDGIIELDIASPAGGNGFAGFAFRIQDEHHYETLYFRPGSSGTINAVQYMPEKKLSLTGGITRLTNTRQKLYFRLKHGFV